MNDMHFSQKKRLLFVNGHLNVGGVEKSLVDLLRHLDYTKYDVDLLLLQELGDYYSELPANVKVIYRDINHVYGPFLQSLWSNVQDGRFADIFFRLILLSSSLFAMKTFRLLRPLLGIAKQYDTAIAYRPGICEDIVAYAVKSNKKLLWWHHGECNYSPDQIAQANKTWLNFDQVVTVSEGCKQMLQRHFSYSAEKYVVIPNLIDINQINQLAGDISPYMDESTIVKLITVGRLSKEKHINNVPLAARLLIDNGYTDFRWYIVGDGDEWERIKQCIAENRVGSYVKMLGSKANPYPYIKFADILVHTSYVESQSITVLEAMTLMTPCVVCKSLGPIEFMEQGQNGILVEQGASELYKGVCDMIKKSNKTDMTQRALEMVETKFSAETIIPLFASLVR